VLGHTNFNNNSQMINNMNFIAMNEVKINCCAWHGMAWPEVQGASRLLVYLLDSDLPYPVQPNIQYHQLIIPGSNMLRVGYVDGGTLRQDTWYSWRKAGEEVAR
jgi:hypothetical protein